jgi:transposase
VERSEAEAIYAQGREPVVEVLLALSARLEAQDAQLTALAERVEELEQRLKRDSRNSSLPPSHDPPWLGKRGRSRETGRKQGGQPGHPGHGRALFSSERLTDVVDHWPERCACGHVFGEEEREPAPARHQLAELPPLAVEINEHRLQRLCCPDCGRAVRVELPAGVPRGCFGPKLEAAIASLTVRNRLSRRQLVELMEELFGCPIAVGTIDAILTRTAETLEPVDDELLEWTRAAGALNIDETGWYLNGEPRTLWGAFSKQTAVLQIAPDRGKQHLHGLIGDEFAGVVGSDRFSAYNSLEPERRQVCWSHLRRDFTFHADLGQGSQETFGLDGLEVTWNVFHAWKQFQQDGDREALQQHVEAIKTQMRPLLEWARPGNGNDTSGHSRRTYSSSGRRCGCSPRCPMSSRPTTRPSAACAPPSFTATPPSAAAPKAANARSNDSSPSTRPAAYNAARSTPTSATSPRKPAATPSPPSPENTRLPDRCQRRAVALCGYVGRHRVRRLPRVPW